MEHTTYHFKARHKTILTVFMAMLLSYLLFHLFVSERSIPSLISLSFQEQRLEKQLTQLTEDYNDVHVKVVGLRPETLDPDLVEEYSIRMLGHGNSNAIIMLDDAS